jgi:dTDP-4-amino-4,6-dideoxygalactose transaminase
VSDPFTVVRDFERAICAYTGAPYCVTVTSCTAALFLACMWKNVKVGPPILLPKLTYVGVAQSIVNAGGQMVFIDEDWQGEYELRPYAIWDAARRFTSGMYRPGTLQCVSFHVAKILGIGQGGAILHDDPKADEWLCRARFDGRREGVHPRDDDFIRGWHCYMSPDTAAQGLWRLACLPKHNADLPRSDYSDLSKSKIFQSSVAGKSPPASRPTSRQNSVVTIVGRLRRLIS